MNFNSEYSPNCTFNSWDSFNKLNKKSNLSFMTINIRSLRGKFDEMCLYLTNLKNKITFLVLTETWLQPNTDILFDIPGYKSYNLFRVDGIGGGIKIYAIDHVPAKVLN